MPQWRLMYEGNNAICMCGGEGWELSHLNRWGFGFRFFPTFTSSTSPFCSSIVRCETTSDARKSESLYLYKLLSILHSYLLHSWFFILCHVTCRSIRFCTNVDAPFEQMGWGDRDGEMGVNVFSWSLFFVECFYLVFDQSSNRKFILVDPL